MLYPKTGNCDYEILIGFSLRFQALIDMCFKGRGYNKVYSIIVFVSYTTY